MSTCEKKKEITTDVDIDLGQIFKNKTNIKHINNLIENFKNKIHSNVKAILIRGPIGCGKMTLLQACTKKYDLLDQIYNSEFENEDILKRLMVGIQTKGFSNLFFKKDKVIIIKNIDETLRPSQKNKFFKYISGTNNLLLPIFMTSSDFSVGTTREVPKCVLQLTFETPCMIDLIRIGTKLAEEYNINISKKALENIYKLSHNDIRHFKNTILNFKSNKRKINVNSTVDYTKNFKLDTFNSIKYCANPCNTLENKIFTSSSYTNSAFFQNYPIIIKDDKITIENLSLISDLVCKAEEIRAYSYCNHVWDTFETKYCLLGTIFSSMLIGDDFSIENMVYPQNTNLPKLNFEILEKDGLVLRNIIKPKFFENNKFVGDINSFNNEIINIYEPIRAYKLAAINDTKKSRDVFLKELRKKLKQLSKK